MNFAVFMAFLLIYKYGHIKCNDEDENGKDTDSLSYRLVMFNPSNVISGGVKEVRENPDDVEEGEEEENGRQPNEEQSDGGQNEEEEEAEEEPGEGESEDAAPEGEQQEEEGEEEDGESAAAEAPKEPSASTKSAAAGPRPMMMPTRPETNKVKEAKNSETRAIYRGILDKWKKQEPYSFAIPDDMQQEIAKIQASKKIPSQLVLKKPVTSEKQHSSTSANMSIQITKAIDEEHSTGKKKGTKKKSKKKKKDKAKSKKKKKKKKKKKDSSKRTNEKLATASQLTDLATKEKALAFASSPYLYDANPDQPAPGKSIHTRDLNLRIRTRNPMPVYIRHYRTTWPYSSYQYPQYNAANQQQRSTAKPGCTKDCAKKKRHNQQKRPKVQTDIVYRKKKFTNNYSCDEGDKDGGDGQYKYPPRNQPTYSYPVNSSPYYSSPPTNSPYNSLQQQSYNYPIVHKPNAPVVAQAAHSYKPNYYYSPTSAIYPQQQQQQNLPARNTQYNPQQGNEDIEEVADYHQREVDTEVDRDHEDAEDDNEYEEEEADETVRHENALTVDGKMLHLDHGSAGKNNDNAARYD